jgi:hypothetical protein
VGVVGTDAYGDLGARLFADEGVGTRHLKRTADLNTGVGFILLDAAGDNRIVLDPGRPRPRRCESGATQRSRHSSTPRRCAPSRPRCSPSPTYSRPIRPRRASCSASHRTTPRTISTSARDSSTSGLRPWC